VAVALALAYLALAIRQNPWCFAFAIVSAAMYAVIFAGAGLVMQVALQFFFIGTAVYGWRQWRGSKTTPGARVTRWPAVRHAAAIAGVVLVAAVNGALLPEPATGARWVPYADAAIAWGSVLATWLVARKLIEHWWYWVAIDLAATVLYGSQGLHATAALYLLYAMLAVRGYFVWRRDARDAA
jgi:nicotinamide mononucleotide transporter